MILAGNGAEKYALKVALQTATSTAGAEAALAGEVIDRFIDTNDIAGSVNFALKYEGLSLTADETVALAITVQDSDNGTDFNTAVAVATYTLTDASDTEGVLTGEVNLSVMGRYVKFTVTPAFTAADTDTVDLDAVAILGNKNKQA